MGSYKINKKDIFKNLIYPVFLIILVIVFSIYCYNYSEFNSGNNLVIILISIQLILTAFLFIDYLTKSTKDIIHIDKDLIVVEKDGFEERINKASVVKAVIYAVPSINRDSNFRIFPFESFHYVHIQIEGSNDIYITSLSKYDLYKSLKKEPIFTDKLYFDKGGLFRNGSALNSIWFNNLKDN